MNTSSILKIVGSGLSQNRKRSSQGRGKVRFIFWDERDNSVTKPQAVITRSIEECSIEYDAFIFGDVTKPQAVITRSSQNKDIELGKAIKLSQNRKRSSQGRGQARKPALQAAEKGIFEKQTNVFLPHK